jgi:hypothetical protein
VFASPELHVCCRDLRVFQKPKDSFPEFWTTFVRRLRYLESPAMKVSATSIVIASMPFVLGAGIGLAAPTYVGAHRVAAPSAAQPVVMIELAASLVPDGQ